MPKALEELPDRAKLRLCLHNSVPGKMTCLKDLEVDFAALDLEPIQVKCASK